MAGRRGVRSAVRFKRGPASPSPEKSYEQRNAQAEEDRHHRQGEDTWKVAGRSSGKRSQFAVASNVLDGGNDPLQGGVDGQDGADGITPGTDQWRGDGAVLMERGCSFFDRDAGGGQGKGGSDPGELGSFEGPMGALEGQLVVEIHRAALVSDRLSVRGETRGMGMAMDSRKILRPATRQHWKAYSTGNGQGKSAGTWFAGGLEGSRQVGRKQRFGSFCLRWATRAMLKFAVYLPCQGLFYASFSFGSAEP